MLLPWCFSAFYDFTCKLSAFKKCTARKKHISGYLFSKTNQSLSPLPYLLLKITNKNNKKSNLGRSCKFSSLRNSPLRRTFERQAQLWKAMPTYNQAFPTGVFEIHVIGYVSDEFISWQQSYFKNRFRYLANSALTSIFAGRNFFSKFFDQ